jgi:hypothetical protein
VNEKQIAASDDKFNEEITLMKGKIENQENQQSRTNNMIKTNFETIKPNFEENLKQSKSSLKHEVQSTAVSLKVPKSMKKLKKKKE